MILIQPFVDGIYLWIQYLFINTGTRLIDNVYLTCKFSNFDPYRCRLTSTFHSHL